jgi:molecular chaperone DnaJ
MSEDYYDILGIGKDADSESIRKAYRREAKLSHPDASGCDGSAERFRKVEEAYETLGDEGRRTAYDRGQGAPGGSSPPVRPGPDPGTRPFRPAEERSSLFPGRFAPPPEPLLEVRLSPAEALRGVELPLSIPVSRPCPACGRGGFWARMFCFTCAGTGIVRLERRLVLEIPPGLRRGGEFLLDSGDPVIGSIRVRVVVE